VQTSVSASATRSARLVARVIAEIVVASMGGVLVVWALAADQRWFDTHFLPAFFVSRHAYVLAQSLARVTAGALGLTLSFVVRPRIGRFVANSPAQVLYAALAAMLAVGASELILQQLHRHAAQEEPAGQEPRRRLDSRFGWTFVPARVARHDEAGRVVEYAFDPSGYRVRQVDRPVDPEQPTILFTGESMMVGEGLNWEETVPAQSAAMLGFQSANLAVSAYASDQAYLRLEAELPRFRRPVAVVALFTPSLFDRNMDDDRPHLGPGLRWLPAAERSRLMTILRLVVRYHTSETVERGIAVTREVLRATCDLARGRGALPLIVVPQFLPEEPAERALRQRILDDSGLPVVRVELDRAWRIPGDGHPDAHAARAIAIAVADRLARDLRGRREG
jgi:hypothetical protein